MDAENQILEPGLKLLSENFPQQTRRETQPTRIQPGCINGPDAFNIIFFGDTFIRGMSELRSALSD
jgi:hypothetical protein